MTSHVSEEGGGGAGGSPKQPHYSSRLTVWPSGFSSTMTSVNPGAERYNQTGPNSALFPRQTLLTAFPVASGLCLCGCQIRYKKGTRSYPAFFYLSLFSLNSSLLILQLDAAHVHSNCFGSAIFYLFSYFFFLGGGVALPIFNVPDLSTLKVLKLQATIGKKCRRRREISHFPSSL